MDSKDTRSRYAAKAPHQDRSGGATLNAAYAHCGRADSTEPSFSGQACLTVFAYAGGANDSVSLRRTAPSSRIHGCSCAYGMSPRQHAALPAGWRGSPGARVCRETRTALLTLGPHCHTWRKWAPGHAGHHRLGLECDRSFRGRATFTVRLRPSSDRPFSFLIASSASA